MDSREKRERNSESGDSEDKKIFGSAVHVLRKRQGMTEEQLAAATGISREYISKIENGKVNPSWKLMRKLDRGMGLPPGAIFDEIRLARRPADSPSYLLNVTLVDGSGDIAEIVVTGVLTPENNSSWVREGYARARDLGASKILQDLSGADCKAFQGIKIPNVTVDSLNLLYYELRYYPTVAIVGNPTLKPEGIQLAGKLGARIELFDNRADALAWLRHQPYVSPYTVVVPPPPRSHSA